MAGATTLDSLGTATYISLTTFRKNGDAVATPVWVVREDDALYVVTEDNSGKVKRLRNNPAVLLAPCDMRGKVLGDVIGGLARVVDADKGAALSRAFAAKYGLTYRVMVLGDRVRRGRKRQPRVVLEITISEGAPTQD